MCLNDKQTDEIYNLATEKKVFIMEAVWSRFMPVYKKLKELIESGKGSTDLIDLADSRRSIDPGRQVRLVLSVMLKYLLDIQ